MEEIYKGKEGMSDLTITAKTDDGYPAEIYAVMKMPMFISNRDIHIKFSKTDLGNGRFLFSSTSINKPDWPSPKGTLRMSIAAYSFVENVGNDLHLVEFANADMKGYIPASLLNMVIGSVTAKEYNDMAIMLANLKEKHNL